MLKYFRHKGIQRNIYIFLAVVVVVSFVLSGIILNEEKDHSTSSLAKFENKQFKVTEYLDSYRAVQHQINFMYGEKAAQMANQINYRSEAWDRLLLLEYAKKQNIKATDKEVIDWIAKQEGFQRSGKFDEKYYNMFVTQAMRSTPRQFEEEIRQMLTIAKIQDSFKEKLDLDDKALKQKYIEEKSEKDLVYGILPYENFEKDVPSVKEETLKPIYDIVKDKLTTPEKVKLKYIYIPKKDDKTPANPALAETSLSLDEISERFSLPIKETALVSKNDYVEDLAAAPEVLEFAFSSEVGKSSKWINTTNGNYMAKLVEKQAEKKLSFEEARTELEKIYKKDEAIKLALNKLNEIKKLITNPVDFEKILKENKVEVTPLEKYKKGMYPAGIWPSENLQKAVSSLNENQVSDAFEIPKGAMIVKVSKIRSVDDASFEKDKDGFKAELQSRINQEEFQKILDSLRKKLDINLELVKEIFPSSN